MQGRNDLFMNPEMNSQKANDTYRNPSWLKHQYITEKYTQQEIADMIKVSRSTISKYIKRFNLNPSKKKHKHERLFKISLSCIVSESMLERLNQYKKIRPIPTSTLLRQLLHEELMRKRCI